MDDSQQLENLRLLYQELHTSRREAESFQNKVAFSFSTILLLLAGIIAKGDYTLAVNLWVKVFVSLIILLAVLIGLSYLWSISVTNRERYKMIVRVEQALGFHTEGVYIGHEEIKAFDGRPYDEATILPERSQQWGERNTRYSYLNFDSVNMFAVGVSGLVALVAVCFA